VAVQVEAARAWLTAARMVGNLDMRDAVGVAVDNPVNVVTVSPALSRRGTLRLC